MHHEEEQRRQKSPMNNTSNVLSMWDMIAECEMQIDNR